MQTVYNSAKQKRKEESAKEDEKGVVGSKVSKLDIAQKSELYREAFIEKVERLSDEVKAAFPDSFWNEMTLRQLAMMLNIFTVFLFLKITHHFLAPFRQRPDGAGAGLRAHNRQMQEGTARDSARRHIRPRRNNNQGRRPEEGGQGRGEADGARAEVGGREAEVSD
jgi:hypothetical protein